MLILDYTIIGIILLVSFLLVWRIHTRIDFADFIIAKKSVDSTHFVGTFVATNVSVAGMLVGVSAAAYQFGLHAMWGLIGWIGGTVLFLFVARRYRVFFDEKTTLFQFIGDGYKSRACHMISAMIMIMLFWGSVAVGLLAVKRIFELFTPGATWIAVLAMLLAVSYTALGGYRGVLATDVFQLSVLGVGLVLISLFLVTSGGVPFVVHAAIHGPKINVSPILLAVSFLLLFLPFQLLAPDMWLRTAASRQFRYAEKGMLFSLPVYFLLFVLTISIGLWAYGTNPNLITGDNAFGFLLKQLVPVGVLGLVLGGVLVAALSTADTCLITICQTVHYDILGSETKSGSLRKLKVVILASGTSALLLPILSPSIVDALFVVFSCQLALLPTVVGMFLLPVNRRSSRGAIVSMLAGFIIGLIWVVAGGVAAGAPIAVSGTAFIFYIPLTLLEYRKGKGNFARKLTNSSKHPS